MVGLGIMNIGFIFIIVVWFNYKVYCYGIIFVLFLSCVIWVLIMGLMLIFRDMVFVVFVVFFIGFDVLFSLGVLIVWCWEMDKLLFSVFFIEFLLLFCDCCGVKISGLIIVIFIIGFI